MPYLSFKMDEKALPIAVVRGGKHNNKIVYLYEDMVVEDAEIITNIEYDDIKGKLKGKKEKDKLQIYQLIEKGIKNNFNSEFLLKLKDDSIIKIYDEVKKDLQKANIIKLEHGAKFETLPTIEEKQRDTVFIFGAANSGKSYWVKAFAENYYRVWSGEKKIYLISELESDETLDNAKCNIIRIHTNNLLEDPIDINSNTYEKCLFIVDDFDTLPKDKYNVVLELINKILIMGRHKNISICVISHYGSNGNKTKLINTECQKYVIFPFGASSHSIQYLLHTHVGIDRKDLIGIKKLGSRWITYSKIFPQYMISENIIKLLNVD